MKFNLSANKNPKIVAGRLLKKLKKFAKKNNIRSLRITDDIWIENNGNKYINDDDVPKNFTGIFFRWCGEALIAERNIKNGKFNGISNNWYENGQIKSILNYVDGHMHGECKSWYDDVVPHHHDDGQLCNNQNFINGEFHGKVESFYYSGLLMSESYYKNGKIDGLYLKWYDCGQLMEKKNYKNGVKDGGFEYYERSGECYCEEYYKNGEEF